MPNDESTNKRLNEKRKRRNGYRIIVASAGPSDESRLQSPVSFELYDTTLPSFGLLDSPWESAPLIHSEGRVCEVVNKEVCLFSRHSLYILLS